MRYSHKLLTFLLLAALVAACTASWRPPPFANNGAAPTGEEIAGLAQGLLGAPYRYGGETPQGFDCSGLVYYIHERLGMDVPRSADAQYGHARQVAVRDLQPGDLVFFRLAGSKVAHVGIYIGNGRFIHAPSTGKDVSYAELDDAWWWNRFVGAGLFYSTAEH